MSKMSYQFKNICWSVTLFLILNPVISVLALVLYLFFSHSYDLNEVVWISVFGLFFAILTNLSITMGYHRLFSHKSYEAHPLLEAFLLFISAGAFQGSCLKWSSDHRIHHRFEDTDKDPYSIKKGFWYAHMGWMMKHDSVSLPIHAPDLQKNWMVMHQHNYYGIWSIGVGYLLPTFVGYLLGNAFLGLVIAGGLRIFLTQQSTFFVNSLSHMLGKTPYSVEKTAKDSLFVAFLTHGEGYHNFHHQFQFDYRNGIRWYHWDPTKWSIQIAELIGLARKLKTVQFSEILKARLNTETLKFKNSKFYEDKLLPMKEKLIQTQIHFEKLKEEYTLLSRSKMNTIKSDYAQAKLDYKNAKSNYTDAMTEKLITLKREMDLAKIEIEALTKQWRLMVKYAVSYKSVY